MEEHSTPLDPHRDAADRAEAAAVQRYLAMRRLWAPCWGAGTHRRPRRGDVSPGGSTSSGGEAAGGRSSGGSTQFPPGSPV